MIVVVVVVLLLLVMVMVRVLLGGTAATQGGRSRRTPTAGTA